MASQPQMTAIRSASGVDVLMRHAQARCMQDMSARGARGVLAAAILAVLALGVALTYYPVFSDSLAAARDRSAAALSEPFAPGVPGSPAVAVRYRLVAE
jgi:hypothetical protein